MHKIKLITDCTSDLQDDFYEKYGIVNLSLSINIGGKSYRDKIDIKPDEMFKMVEEYNELPKTSAIAPSDFLETFKQLHLEGYEILYMGIGSGFSSTYHNATLAKAEIPEAKIELIDSKNLSSGIGLLLLKALKFIEEGFSLSEIAKKINDLVPKVRSMFSINTLEYLHKGGRCSGLTKFISSVLKLRPIIRVVDNQMVVGKKPRGKYKAALDAQLEYLKKDIGNIDTDNVFITHCLAEDEDIEYLKAEIPKYVKADNIHITTASSVISTHCGPRTIGVLYIAKE